MVSNVTSLPTQSPTTLSLNRPAGAPAGERAGSSGREAAVEVSVAGEYRGDVFSARADLADARGALDLALGVGRQVRIALTDLRDLALRAADPGVPDAARQSLDGPFRTAVQSLAQRIEREIAGGATLLAGQALEVRADPDSDAAVDIAGVDLRLKETPADSDIVSLARGASIATPEGAAAAAKAATASLTRLDGQLRRLEGDGARLGQHDAVLGALDAALAQNVKPDLDADAARLLALQVRQDLSQGSSPIANARPSSLLAYFRD